MSDLKSHEPISGTISVADIIIIAAAAFGAGCLVVGYTLKPSLEKATYEAQYYRAKAMEIEVSKDALLKAEVERLTKLFQATSPDGCIHKRDINSAKEGKQP